MRDYAGVWINPLYQALILLYNVCMKVNFGQKTDQEQPEESKGRTSIATHLIKSSVLLDINNNEIDLRTKRIIKRAGQDE